MVHTHASLPRGFCSGSQAVKAIIRSLKRKWLQNTGKNHQLNWMNPKAHKASSGNASMRRACSDNVRVDSAKWLARWAKSAAEKIWTGCRERSSSVSSRRSSMAMLASLSLLRMFQRNVASWWIWTGGGVMSTLAMMESVSSMPDSCTEAGLSGAASIWGCQFPYGEISGIWK